MTWQEFKKTIDDYLSSEGCDKDTTEITFFFDETIEFQLIPLTFKDAEIVDGVFVHLKADK